MKIGFLLGSFDPIHIGHIYMATSALNFGMVDKVIFVPAFQNPWKTESTNFRDRYLMTSLAVESIPNCEVSSIDYNNTSPYYTSNTLKMLMRLYPNDELYIIVGMDIVDQIDSWYEGGWILKTFKLIVIARDGYKGFVNHTLPNTLNVSSTLIRELSKEGKQTYPLVPKIIDNYIKQHKLYE